MDDDRSRPSSADDDRGLQGKSTRDRVFRLLWVYLRGWFVILVAFLVVKAAVKAYGTVAVVIEPLFESLESSAPGVVATFAILIVGPWVLGKILELIRAGSLFRKHRNVRAVMSMESRLATELKADRHRGYRVVLVNWPSAENRSLGLTVADFLEPGTGRELAAVFFPNTPDPTKGAIRVVGAADLQPTEWDLSDLARFHVTFGSAAPDLTDEAD